MFTTGADLSGAFYAEVVRPLLHGDAHSAALLGWGSDVLGYDTQRSTDHGWGPRLIVFLDDARSVRAVAAGLDGQLPDSFRSWPVRYGWDDVAATHHVTVTTLPAWLTEHLGVDASAGMSTLDWLLTPQQQLLGVVAGRVYSDDSGALGRLRAALSWYPDQVWRWLLACQWHRLAQEEAFVSRNAETGDGTGAGVVTARLVRDMMRLALLLDRRYAPYQKWLGTAFAAVEHHDDLPRFLAGALHNNEGIQRELALGRAFTTMAERHNAAGLTEPMDAGTRSYHQRPALVLMADRFTDALLATVTDPDLRALPLIGSVDQAVDSTDVLTSPKLFRRLSSLYSG
jgi:hypothetical protein